MDRTLGLLFGRLQGEEYSECSIELRGDATQASHLDAESRTVQVYIILTEQLQLTCNDLELVRMY